MKSELRLGINLKNLQKTNKSTLWYRAIYYALIISVAIFTVACLYLFFKSIPSNITTIIDQEISSTNVKFDTKTLEMVKERQNPKETTESSSGKNPFSPL